MGPTALLPLRRKACWGFFRTKNPTAGCEPPNLGTKSQHAIIDHRSRLNVNTLTKLTAPEKNRIHLQSVMIFQKSNTCRTEARVFSLSVSSRISCKDDISSTKIASSYYSDLAAGPAIGVKFPAEADKVYRLQYEYSDHFWNPLSLFFCVYQ
jgi:hypothetical protein